MGFVYIWTTSSWLTQIWKSQRFPPHTLRSTDQRMHNQASASRKQETYCVCTAQCIYICTVTSSHVKYVGTTPHTLFLVVCIKRDSVLCTPLYSLKDFHNLYC